MTDTFRSIVLPNGLQVIAEIQPAALTTALGFFVATGSRDELGGESGVSHFLEHMLFKSTQSGRTAAEVNQVLDELGGYANAYTCEDHTAYHATVIPRYQDRLLDVLSDMMRPALLEDDFEPERQVVLEEIARSDDAPPYGAYERVMEAYFATHPLSHRVLGTTQSIGSMTAADMRRYFDRRYGPKNVILAAAGCVDWEQLVHQATEATEHWPAAAQVGRPDSPLASKSNGKPREPLWIDVPQSQQTYAIGLSATPSARDPDRWAMRLLASILGDDSGSRLFWELVDTGRAESASLAPHEFDDLGLMMSFLVCDPDSIDENLERFSNVLKVSRGGIRSDELQRAKQKTCAGLALQAERPGNRLFQIGSDWLSTQTYQSLDDLLASYQQVTLEQVHTVQERFPLEPTTLVLTRES
jgi:predicted Zn-dependent peptidase